MKVHRIDFQTKKTLEARIDLMKFDPEEITRIRNKFIRELFEEEVVHCEHEQQMKDGRGNLVISKLVSA